jgi:DNA polymerase-3 subunit gamma/tau
MPRTTVKLEPFVQTRTSDAIQQIRAKWPEVLQRVKEISVSLHAWLINGEAVARIEDNLLLAFKNAVHRETTEKPANREIIERVLQDVLGRPIRFSTVMQIEWQEASEGAPEAAGELHLQPEDSAPADAKPEWVEEAIKMFGEDLVVVIDDDKSSK